MLGWIGRRQDSLPKTNDVPLVEVETFEEHLTSLEPLELQTVRRTPQLGTGRDERWIGLQSETERYDMARCVVDGIRAGAGRRTEVYLRHATALVLQQEEAASPFSSRQYLVGVSVGRRRSIV